MIGKIICKSKVVQFHGNFELFYGRDSAESSAEASVKLAEASVSAESQFTPIRSFTIKVTLTKSGFDNFVA